MCSDKRKRTGLLQLLAGKRFFLSGIGRSILFLFCSITVPSAGWAAGSDNIGTALPLWSALPFAGILLSIALLPLLAPRFWHRHFPKVSAFWALAFALPFLYFFPCRRAARNTSHHHLGLYSVYFASMGSVHCFRRYLH